MGIRNIHILIQEPTSVDRTRQVQATYLQSLVDDHRRGKHPWGSMRRDCPLCQGR